MQNEISYLSEFKRKIFHFLIILFPIAYLNFSKKEFLTILFPIAIIFIFLDYQRHHTGFLRKITHGVFSNILRNHEHNELSGVSYTLISACIVFSFCPKMTAINAFTILAISDSIASLIGRKIKSNSFFEKSIAGTSAFAISAILIIIFYGIYFNQKFHYYIFGFIGVFVATMIEARPSLLKLNDNLTIPLSYSIVVVLFEMLWVYNF